MEVYSGGDEELASSKLRDAGTDLYMCCEWALKNYLYRKYDEQLDAHEIPSHLREYKVNQLSAKTATMQYLLNELEDVGTLPTDTIGVDSQKIIRNAKEVNNGPKHDRTIPDPRSQYV